VGDRDAGQRPAFAARQSFVGGARLNARLLARVDGDEGVELRVVAGDAVEVEPGQLDARDLLAGQRLRSWPEAVCSIIR
jgi:hypothetical protein